MALEALNSPTIHTKNAPIWSKGKRSKRQRVESQPTEEEYLALCLIMLARGHVSSPPPSMSSSCSMQYPGSATVYNCSVCGKGFGSYQALGGHKASHRKSIGRLTPSRSVAHNICPVADKKHECSVCGRSFATGQALGGHKRRHYDGGVTSSEGMGSTTVSGRVFDLNVTVFPELWEDEVESPHPAKKLRQTVDTYIV